MKIPNSISNLQSLLFFNRPLQCYRSKHRIKASKHTPACKTHLNRNTALLGWVLNTPKSLRNILLLQKMTKSCTDISMECHARSISSLLNHKKWNIMLMLCYHYISWLPHLFSHFTSTLTLSPFPLIHRTSFMAWNTFTQESISTNCSV